MFKVCSESSLPSSLLFRHLVVYYFVRSTNHYGSRNFLHSIVTFISSGQNSAFSKMTSNTPDLRSFLTKIQNFTHLHERVITNQLPKLTDPCNSLLVAADSITTAILSQAY